MGRELGRRCYNYDLACTKLNSGFLLICGFLRCKNGKCYFQVETEICSKIFDSVEVEAQLVRKIASEPLGECFKRGIVCFEFKCLVETFIILFF